MVNGTGVEHARQVTIVQWRPGYAGSGVICCLKDAAIVGGDHHIRIGRHENDVMLIGVMVWIRIDNRQRSARHITPDKSGVRSIRKSRCRPV